MAGEPQRIAKLLARAGIASRREIERMIAEGRVSIDGAKVEKPATLLTSLRGVTVDGRPVREPAPARLFRYHKPRGLLTTERDPKGRPTIYDRLPRGLPRVMPVGRLDMNTEGLLLLTTDGELKRQLELPATGVERTYRARTFGAISQPQLEALIEGIEIDGVRYGSIDANLERSTGHNQWIEMKLREGKNREVRRVLEHLGLEVSRLIRTAYGPFALADLPPGAVDEVRPQGVAAFRANPTRTDLPGSARPRVHAAGVSPAPPRAPAPAAASPRPKRPARPGKRAPADGDAIARPARAARARAHRAATGRDDVPAARSREAAPRSGPGPRGKPRDATGRPARPAPGARGKSAPSDRDEASARPRDAMPRPAHPAPGGRGKPRRGGPPRTRK